MNVVCFFNLSPVPSHLIPFCYNYFLTFCIYFISLKTVSGTLRVAGGQAGRQAGRHSCLKSTVSF
jgi:hypothetical protein